MKRMGNAEEIFFVFNFIGLNFLFILLPRYFVVVVVDLFIFHVFFLLFNMPAARESVMKEELVGITMARVGEKIFYFTAFTLQLNR